LKLEDWKTYTSLTDVRTITVDTEGKIWAGTTGGVFIYNTKGSSIEELRNTEGLLNLNISCIRSNDKDKSIFICSSNGIIQIHNSNGTWDYVTDIISAKFPDPLITDIEFINDTAYISGGFGLSKFNTKELVFIETVIKFGTLTSGIRANDILFHDGYLWVATEEGVARTVTGASIANPSGWEVFSKSDSGTLSKAKFLMNYNDTLVVATENSICKFESSGFTLMQNSADNEKITGLSIIDGKLIYSTENDVYSLDNTSLNYGKYRNINGIQAIPKSGNGKTNLVALFRYYGFSIFDKDNETNILPNSPISNNFMNLDVDGKGRIWIATKPKSETDGQGFMMFDGNNWYNYNTWNNPLVSNWALKIKSVSSGDVFVSTWGGGLLKLQEKIKTGNSHQTEFEITKYDTSNSPFTGAINTAPNFVICGEVVEDFSGKIWIINYGEGSTGPLITAMQIDGSFLTFNNLDNLTERQYVELAIDRYGTKWLGSNSFAKGLFYYNDNNTPENKSDDKFGKYTKSNNEGLLDNEINSIAVDKNGFIWLGTNMGLNFIYDSYPAKSGSKVSIRELTLLRNPFIHDIYVDAVNNKWIATNKGVWVLNEDASELLNPKILNSSNSPLIDDEVFSITSDPKTGVMFFGTKYGLSSARSLFAQSSTEYNISCYPQPFNPRKDRELYIDGLMENSDVRILTVDGTLVKEITAKGRIASWDGKDELGLVPNSGVYIVVGSSLTADGKGVGKFTLINK